MARAQAPVTSLALTVQLRAKLRSRTTAEAIIGGVTGTLTDPDTLLLGRLDDAGRLRYVGRTHPLAAEQRRQLAGQL